MNVLRIKDIKVITCNPNGKNLVTVKVETTDPQIYGYGCATFHQRYMAVVVTIESYLKELLIGRDPRDIEDIWQLVNTNSYWRNGPVLNNALSGIDMALWDIKGKLADMPLYQLLGGRTRAAIPAYVHAKGSTHREVEGNVRKFMDQGYKYIRCQIGEYGGIFNNTHEVVGLPEGAYFDPETYMGDTIELFDYLSEAIEEPVMFLHDVHERLEPMRAIAFAKALEKFNLYYLEDIFSPEQQDWLKVLRQHTTIPIAMGELYTSTQEWKNAIENKWIDYIRIHLSDIGGLTPAKKIATFAEIHGIKTAWHGSPDLTPIGMATNIHLGIATPNTGIQEYCSMGEDSKKIFIGSQEPKNGYFYPSEAPGIGIEVNEDLAKEYPCKIEPVDWTNARLPDGTSVKP